jgi:hypothetical protein
MSEYSNIIQGSFAAAPARAVSAVDDDPENAARSIDLASATGVPATAIAGDLDGFERNHKAQLAGDIVRNNPQIADYINSHPLAAAISNDDLGNLDSVSEKAQALAQLQRKQMLPSVFGVTADPRALSEGWEKLQEGWGQPGAWMKDADIKNHQFLGALGLSAELPVRALNALAQGALGFIHGATVGGAEGFGVQPSEAQRFARDITAIGEKKLVGEEVHTPALPSPKLIEGLQAARPWLEHGLEPPKGVHPEIDRLKAEANVRDLQTLDEALVEAQTSTTRERNPDMFAGFVRQHLGESKIGISGDRIAELYGDKVPTADDGLLGWVPGIKDQIDAARATGSDVQVPIADWLAKVDPKVAADLHDDIRVQPGNITAREVELDKAAEAKPTIAVDAPLAQTRAAASLEPLYSIGDRKLTMQRFGKVVPGYENFHDFQLMDQNGTPVGVLNLSMQGKKLYVEGIEGINGLGPRDFGPSLMRDILRQLKAEFPEAETISGYRVSGARFGKAAIDNNVMSRQPEIKFDVSPEGWAKIEGDIEGFTKALQEQQWEKLSPWLMGLTKPKELYTTHEKALSDAVTSEIRAIAPKGVEVKDVQSIEGTARGGLSKGIQGAYQQFVERKPIIVYALEGKDPLGTGRHEAIHHLRQSGFFTEGEWKTLTDAAISENWIQKFDIDRRYAGGDAELKLEEAVADGFRDWNRRQDSLTERAKSLVGIESPLDTIFKRIKELLDNLKEKFKAILGHEPTWEELFEQAHSGEIGSREGAQPINPTVYKEMLSAGEERSDMLRANATGLDLKSYKAIQKLIQERHAEDVAAATKRIEAEQARRQTKEWKDNRKELRAQIEDQIYNRPDVAADIFLSSGELFGKKLAGSYKLRTEDLTPEQRASIPKNYQSKTGLPPDEVAKLFGYGSGDAMIGKLAEYNTAKGDLSARDFVKTVVDTETDRQMEAKYGLLEKNIMEDAKDQVLSETQLNILAEEMHAVGIKAGVATIDKNVAQAWVKDRFSKLSIGDVTSDAFLRDVGRHGRDAERMLIAEKPTEALQSLQKKYLSALFANEAKKLEKQVERFDRDAKRFSKREIASMEPEYVNFIHQILTQVGKPIRRSIQDLQESIEASGHKNLEEFVATKEASLRELPVADFLYDSTWRKPYESLNVDEFRAISDSVKALAHNARDERKIYRAGEAADFAEKKTEMMEQLEQFQIKHYDTKGKRWLGPIPPKIATVIRTYVASHMQMEGLFNRWDKFDPRGVWNQYVMRDLVEGANQEAAWRTEFAKKLSVSSRTAQTLNKAVENPRVFKDPLGGGMT